MITWLGWKTKWAETVNLLDILPQNRERFLMVMGQEENNSKQDFVFRMWTKNVDISLQSCDILRDRSCLSHKWVPELSIDTLRRYMHPKYVPGDGSMDCKTTKLYRLRYDHQTLSCVLAQYGQAHLLDEDILARKGLYGNLIISGDSIRWLSLPELCSAMGLMRRWVAPLSPHEAYKMIGNAISTLHALLCLVNALGTLNDVDWQATPVDLLACAFRLFLSASRQEVLISSDTQKLEIRSSRSHQHSRGQSRQSP